MSFYWEDRSGRHSPLSAPNSCDLPEFLRLHDTVAAEKNARTTASMTADILNQCIDIMEKLKPLVQTQADLDILMRQARKTDTVALDTEFVWESSPQPKKISSKAQKRTKKHPLINIMVTLNIQARSFLPQMTHHVNTRTLSPFDFEN